MRFFSVWGPGQRPGLALEAFTCRILAGKPLIINGAGTQRRDLTHVSDVARAVELALRWPGPRSVVLNVGTDRNHSVLVMVDAAAKNAAALHFTGSNLTEFDSLSGIPWYRLTDFSRRDIEILYIPFEKVEPSRQIRTNIAQSLAINLQSGCRRYCCNPSFLRSRFPPIFRPRFSPSCAPTPKIP